MRFIAILMALTINDIRCDTYCRLYSYESGYYAQSYCFCIEKKLKLSELLSKTVYKVPRPGGTLTVNIPNKVEPRAFNSYLDSNEY